MTSLHAALTPPRRLAALRRPHPTDELRALKKACWSVLKRNVEEISTYPGLEARTAKKVGAKLR